MALYSKISDHKHFGFLKVNEMICHKLTKYQEIEIFKSDYFGKTLVLDEELQTCEVDYFTYHEALVGSPYTPKPHERMLILGSGEGVSIDVALRKGWKNIDAIELDGEAMEIYREHLSDWNNHIYDRQDEFNLVIDDGYQVLQVTPDNYYSYIIFDLPSIGLKQNQREWLEEIHRCLLPQGLVSCQDGNKYEPSYSGPLLKDIFGTMPDRRTMMDWSFCHCVKKCT